MMKNIISSPYRKMKILFILPVFAIVLYSFAKPDYKYSYVDENSGKNDQVSSSQTKAVKGTVQQQDGKPLKGATVVLRGTTLGASTDAKGYFKLDNVPDDGSLIVSYVGFKSKVLKPVFTSEMTINMMRDTVKYMNTNISTPPPPPPPQPLGVKFRGDGPPPLYLVDGLTVSQDELDRIDPNSIESVSVMKDKYATEKYGEKGKNGVIKITTKKKAAEVVQAVPEPGKDAFVVVEEMPKFPGGKDAMSAWIAANIKYPEKLLKAKSPERYLSILW